MKCSECRGERGCKGCKYLKKANRKEKAEKMKKPDKTAKASGNNKTKITRSEMAAGVENMGNSDISRKTDKKNKKIKKKITRYVTGYMHIGIPTDNMKATTKFYKSLGFKLLMKTENNGKPVKFFEHSKIVIETYTTDKATAHANGAVDHIALACTDIVSCVKYIKKKGYEVCEGPAFLPYWDFGTAYIKILGPNHEAIEFARIFESQQERDEALKALGL